MYTLQVILGSTRPTRAADPVARWILDRASQHEAFQPELLDLRDWPLPMFGEHLGTIGDFRDPPTPTHRAELERQDPRRATRTW